VDSLTNYGASGWASDAAHGGTVLEARLDGDVLARTRANEYRSDLAAAGHGDGRHGFTLRFPRSLNDSELPRLQIISASAGLALPLAPGAVRPLRLLGVSELGEAGLPHAPHFRSRFGGLWTDLSNAMALLQGKRELGLVSAADHERLKTWICDGYVILRGAVQPDLCDRVCADADRAAAGSLPLFRELTGPDGIMIVPAAGSREGKLIDLYTKSEAALGAITHEAIAHFLALIFERPALAFQSLYFEHGSEQPLHQDTAFVPVSSPLQLAASWIALEDIREGTGELQYVPGSHAIPEFLFDGAFRTMPPGSPEEPAFYAHLERSIAERGLTSARFLPSKGDVLIWSADLAHGGTPIASHRPTRRSLVAHYCPIDCRPAYFTPDCTIVPTTTKIASTSAPRLR
jgi:hypothetical protein